MQINSSNEFNASDNICNCNCNKDMRAVEALLRLFTCRVLPRTPLPSFFLSVIIVSARKLRIRMESNNEVFDHTQFIPYFKVKH